MAAHWACIVNALLFTENLNDPETDLQTVIVGLTFFTVAPACPALPITKALLPKAMIGAKSSNRAECVRVLLCTGLLLAIAYRATPWSRRETE